MKPTKLVLDWLESRLNHKIVTSNGKVTLKGILLKYDDSTMLLYGDKSILVDMEKLVAIYEEFYET